MVVPIGQRVVEFNGLITLNESGALLWKRLEEGVDAEELVASILSEYDVDEAEVKNDVSEFVNLVLERRLCE